MTRVSPEHETTLSLSTSSAWSDVVHPASVASRGRAVLPPTEKVVEVVPRKGANLRVVEGGKGGKAKTGTGRAQASGATESRTIGVGKDGMVTIDGAPHLRDCARVAASRSACDCGSVPVPPALKSEARSLKSSPLKGLVDMKKVEALMDQIDECTPPERSMLFGMLCEDLTVDVKKIAALFDLVRSRCSETELDALRGMIDDNFCTDCGDTLPEEGEPAHECPDDDDDEDDEEDADDDEPGDASGDTEGEPNV